jgi:hypothetical protein
MGCADVLEVHEDSLRGFRPQVGDARVVLERADVGFEHEIERARRGQRSGGARARRENLRAECFVLQRIRHCDDSQRLPAPRLLDRRDSLAMRLEQLDVVRVAHFTGRCV